MKLLTNFFSSAATRFPVITIIMILVITGFFGYMTTQAEELDTGFGGEIDTPEIEAQGKLSDYFGGSGTQSVLQLVFEGEDVLTVEGYETYTAAIEVIENSELYDYLVNDPNQGLVQGFFAPIDVAKAFNPMLDVSSLSDEQFKQLYKATSAQMPAEFQQFASALLSSSYDEEAVTATAGLGIITINSAIIQGEYGFEGAFEVQPRLENELNKELLELSDDFENIDIAGFSLALLFGDEQDDFLEEVAQLFGAAFGIIFLVLAFIFFIKPTKTFGFFKSSRRTFADIFNSLAAIMLAILWMQGIGVVLGPGYLDIIGAPNQLSQISTIIILGLGVDYAIHFTGRYREELGLKNSVNTSASKTLSSVGIALTLATLGTMVGFLTNIVSPLTQLQDFGITTALGIFYAFILVMTLVPAIRTLLDKRSERKNTIDTDAFASSGEKLFNKLSEATSIIPKRLKIIAVSLILGIGGYGYYSFTNISTVFNFTDFLPSDSPTVKTFNTLQDEFGGGFGETTSVLIESDNVATPEIHNALIDSLSNLSDVENVLVFAGNAAAESVVGSLGAMLVPPSANPQAPPPMPDMALIGQLGTYGVQIMSGQGLDALKVSSSGDVEGLYTYLLETDEDTFSTSLYVNENDLISAMQVRITTSAGTSGAAQIRDDLYTAFEPLSDLGIFVGVTSDNIVTESVNELINSSQFQSLVFAILASMIFLVLYYLIDMRRPFLGVITVLPVAAIVLGTYMGMYLLDIPLNPVTSTLSGLAIGIGVPFVIHVTNRFRETISSGIEPVEAIRTTLKTTGGSLFGSAFTTMAGFGILTTSSLVPFQQMGTVILVSIGFALIASLMILPTFLVIWANYHNKKTAKTL
ncbi:MMPL family transporter [Acidimicrobiaceae bacterium]|nr:MMPL family transporter [Acidimicrobiaceae bacterium]